MTVTAFLKKSNLTCQTEGMNIITMDLCTFSVAALDEQRDHIQFGRTEYIIHLLSYIRLHWTTSEFSGRLQNLLDDFRIYWTTSDFYWTTWVLEVKISSATWPGGSVLMQNELFWESATGKNTDWKWKWASRNAYPVWTLSNLAEGPNFGLDYINTWPELKT